MYDANEKLDPSIGKISFKYSQWGYGEDGTYIEVEEEIESHTCSHQELGLTGDKKQARFMPIHKASKSALKQYKDGFLCIEDEQLELYGDWNSDSARTIQISLERCSREAYCKSDEEIDQFLKGTYLMLLNNQIRFDSTNYGTEAIKLESRVRWYSIST